MPRPGLGRGNVTLFRPAEIAAGQDAIRESRAIGCAAPTPATPKIKCRPVERRLRLMVRKNTNWRQSPDLSDYSGSAITTDSQVSVGILGIMATFSTACKLFACCRQCGLSSIKPVVTFRQQAPQRTPHRRRGRVASRPREARSPRVRDHQRAPGRVAFKFFLAAQAAQVPPADPRRVAGLAHDLDGVATGRRVVLAIAAEPGSQPGGRRSHGVRCAAALV